MLSRRDLILIGAGASLAADLPAQTSARIPVVGVLGATTAAGYASRWQAMRDGMAALGYVEGKNIAYEYRWADGDADRLPALATELARLRVNVIVTHGIPGTRAAKQASSTIPIVMAIVTDPVAAGLVDSFARPGGNVTGTAWFAPELAAKRLELIREFMPRAVNVGVLTNPGNPAFSKAMLRAMQDAAPALKLRLEAFEATGPTHFERAFSAMSDKQVDAAAIVEEAVLNSHPGEIASLANMRRIPTVGNNELALAGGMIGYGPNLHELFRRAATFIDRLLKGAAARDMPIEQASTFELTVNMRTVRALGASIPQSLMLRADRVLD